MAVKTEKDHINDDGKKKALSYTKEQILASDRYRNRRDLVDALLMDGESYTMGTVDKKITDFMKGRVK